jgi:hypothetical protein
LVGGEIRAGPDAADTRHRPGGRRVDAADDAVGLTAANHPGLELAWQTEIVGVAALAADERIVFLASDRLTDAIVLRCGNWNKKLREGVILHETPQNWQPCGHWAKPSGSLAAPEQQRRNRHDRRLQAAGVVTRRPIPRTEIASSEQVDDTKAHHQQQKQ